MSLDNSTKNMFNTKNIKISLRSEKISLNSVIEYLNKNLIVYQIKGNYIVIREKYVYIFFKLKDSLICHINVTKIPNFESIKDSIELLQQKILNGSDINISEYKIDNLTAIYDAKTCIDLLRVVENARSKYRVRYNKEKFPGLFIRTDQGTFIIFHTGKVNLVGCQHPDHLPVLFKCLENILM
jgi:TATA-box binding protein (TBP) (component of TFIID and TFIIIB)